jgi:hypothetical protein
MSAPPVARKRGRPKGSGKCPKPPLSGHVQESADLLELAISRSKGSYGAKMQSCEETKGLAKETHRFPLSSAKWCVWISYIFFGLTLLLVSSGHARVVWRASNSMSPTSHTRTSVIGNCITHPSPAIYHTQRLEQHSDYGYSYWTSTNTFNPSRQLRGLHGTSATRSESTSFMQIYTYSSVFNWKSKAVLWKCWTCQKCAITDYTGGQKVLNCQSSCHDCKKMKNPKRLEGWD